MSKATEYLRKYKYLGFGLVAVVLYIGLFAIAEQPLVHAKQVVTVNHVANQIALLQPKKQLAAAAKKTKSQSVATTAPVLSSRQGGLLSINPGPWLPFVATWYDGQGGINGTNLTATGNYVRNEWTCAVDPHTIPLGSIIEVKFPNGSQKIYQALDVGGAIRGNHIDIFDGNASQCLTNGVQKISVRILIRGPQKQ